MQAWDNSGDAMTNVDGEAFVDIFCKRFSKTTVSIFIETGNTEETQKRILKEIEAIKKEKLKN